MIISLFFVWIHFNHIALTAQDGYLNVDFRGYLNVDFRGYLNVDFGGYLNVDFHGYLNLDFRSYLNVDFRSKAFFTYLSVLHISHKVLVE